MKFRILLLVALLLTFVGCGSQSNTFELPPTPTPPQPERAATMTRTILIDGIEKKVNYTLVKGDGWSFYLTDDDWVSTGNNEWASSINENVKLWIESYPGQTADELKAALIADGFNDDLHKSGGVFQYAAVFNGYVFMYELPAYSGFVSGWGVRLASMAQTFSVE